MRESHPVDPHAAISYTEAAAIVGAYAAKLLVHVGLEDVPLLDAYGRVVAEPVLADREQPPFARSTRDGFACRAADTVGTLHVTGLLKAGQEWTLPPLAHGEAVEIMTGAPMPPGADCVVMVEHASRVGDRVSLLGGRNITAGENFIPRGAEAQKGSMLFARGVRLGPPQVAAAASAGRSRLEVYHRPRVAILATGDELVPVAEQPMACQIRNSNSYSLATQVLALGGVPVLRPIIADTEDALQRALRSELEDDCDLMLLTGGVSMGKYDLVEDALAWLQGRFFFTGVQMQPGKPVVFGEFAETASRPTLPFFGLPGNPVSTMVTFALFAAPVLAALGGEIGYAPRFAEARLGEQMALKRTLRRFLPGRLSADAEGATVRQVPWQGSGDIAGTAQANCLIVVPELTVDSGDVIEAGEAVRILML